MKKKMSMSQNDTLHLVQKFLGRMGSGAEPAPRTPLGP
jgi:hypothetical protein